MQSSRLPLQRAFFKRGPAGCPLVRLRDVGRVLRKRIRPRVRQAQLKLQRRPVGRLPQAAAAADAVFLDPYLGSYVTVDPVKPKKPKPIPGTPSPRVLSSAECARRTGVTVRTLRVYEREGLIKPQRSANGWRVYGEREVQRMNDIITLKTLGLSLREIRAVLSAANPPSLLNVLQLQLKAWLARQAATEQAIKLVRAALARLAANDALSIDELCELVRTSDMSQPVKTLREMANEVMKPEERAEYLGWWAGRPIEVARSIREFGEAQRPLLRELENLRAEGAEPTAPNVQALLGRHRALMIQHGVLEQTVALMEWNPGLTRKWMDVGERFRSQTLSRESGAPGSFGSEFYRFFVAAAQASKPGQALKPILLEARDLIRRKLLPASKEGQGLARRMKDICRRFRLGDPAVYALSMAFIVKTERDGQWQPLDHQHQAPYRFLAEAIRSP